MSERAARFDEVLSAELDSIRARRTYQEFGRDTVGDGSARAPTPEDGGSSRARALQMNLTGLALSGGGIRSATFSLGVLQGLAGLGLLKRFDYLSTVSGGGYIGGWLAAWIKREGSVENVERQLRPDRADQARARRSVGEVPLPDRLTFDEEPEPLHHLRSYSDFLSPRAGLFTADTWTLFAIYIRNFLINLLIILPATMVLVILARLVVLLYDLPGSASARGTVSAMSVAFLVFMYLALLMIAREVRNLHLALDESGLAVRELSGLSYHFFILLPLLASAILACWILGIHSGGAPGGQGDPILASRLLSMDPTTWQRLVRPPTAVEFATVVISLALLNGALQLALYPLTLLFSKSRPGEERPEVPGPAPRRVGPGQILEWPFWGGVAGSLLAGSWWLAVVSVDVEWRPAFSIAAFFAIMNGVVHMAVNWPIIRDLGTWRRHPPLKKSWRRFLMAARLIWVPFISGATGGVLVYLLGFRLLPMMAGRPDLVATFGPPLFVAIFVLSAIVEVGLLSRRLEEDEREWWARLCAQLMMYALGWVALFATTILLVESVQGSVKDKVDLRAILAALASGWAAISSGGVMAARGVQQGAGEGGGVSARLIKLLAAIAPPVFVLGLLVATSWLGILLMPTGPVAAGSASLVFGLEVALGLVLLSGYLIDANLFSLHAMYANRLTRCFLGASRPKDEWRRRARRGWDTGRGGAPTDTKARTRHANAITGFDFHDDIPLWSLKTGLPEDAKDCADKEPYWGPYPLFNTSLNLIAGKELAWRNRKADSFVLTPNYCGSRSTGYRLLKSSSDRNLTLGRAMAISGAAADPNMSVHQSASQTALMTVFNARLGWWLQNPRKFADWDAQGPRFGLQLLNELRGKTDEHGDYVHLSDGGHLENLGVYELIRRRCRYIVACDAAQDRQATSDNLANMMRMCRTDFGVRIELDTTPLEPESPKGFSRWHCAVGEIRYDEVDPEELPGVLIYIRLSMTGDEPADVQEYAAKSPDFPHQSTVDQFFDETQFESYRALGNTSAARSSPKRSRIPKASPGWPSASAPGRPPNSAGWPGTGKAPAPMPSSSERSTA